MHVAILLQLVIIAAWAATILRHTRRLLQFAQVNTAWMAREQRADPLTSRIWWWLGREEFWRTVQLDALRCVEITLMMFVLAYPF